MKKLFLLNLFILLYINISSGYCQSKYLSDMIKNDTLWIHEQDIINHSNGNINLDDLKLEDNHTIIPNYLVIQLDSNTFSLDTNRDSFFETKVFWINDIKDLYYERNYLFYSPIIPLIEEGFHKFKEGEKNNLTEYFYYLYLFNLANVSKARELNISYLLNSNNLINTKILHKQTIFIRKDNPNIMYVIFKVNFWGIAIFDKINQRNLLVPLTSQLFFEPIYYKSVFNRMFREDENFILNYFQISSIKLKIIEIQRYIRYESD